MKKLIPLLLVSAVAAYLLLGRRKPESVAEALPMPRPMTENVTPPSPRERKLLQEPRPRVAVPKSLSKECETYLTQLRSLDLSTLQAPLAAPQGLPKGEGCGAPPQALASRDAAYREACLGNSTDAQTCLTALFFYRAAVTEWLTRQTPVSEISDPATLTDKLFARFMTDPAGAAEVAERLLDLEPDLYPAAKAALLSRLMDAQKNAQGKPNDPRWQKVDDLFPKMERGGREDAAQLFELRMVTDIIKDPKPDYASITKEAQDFSRLHPESGVGPYHLAWAAYRQGHPAAALDYLGVAYAREKSPRYAETAERIKKGEAEPFRTNLSFSLNPNLR